VSCVETDIHQILTEAVAELETAADQIGIEAISVKYLGRKGRITQFLRSISQIPESDRPLAGKRANEVKKALNGAIQAALARIDNAQTEPDGIDVSLPGRITTQGAQHPISKTNREICEIFSRIGFDIVEGPEVETDYYNFEALNFPKNHPARDMQDTFFVSDDIVLRTHT